MLAFLPGPVHAQMGARDLTVTGGVSWESYDGNFSAVTVPVVDSSEHAVAAVGEFSFRARIRALERTTRYLDFNVEGGLRQFAAMGFQLRDYAPREWVSRAGLSYSQLLGAVGQGTLRAAYRGRSVEDRPPLPLFLQPGYASVSSSALVRFRAVQGVAFDVELDAEHSDYEAPRLLPQLDLLDRSSQGVELGARTESPSDLWSVRFFAGLRWSQYEQQATLDDRDPFRRDRTVNAGLLWSLDASDLGLLASFGVEGALNRSNSRRPEYDAFRFTGDVSAVLPWWDLSSNLYALLTWKTYVQESGFARLVPGEEADNASVVYLDFVRPIFANLDGVLRFGWTRAETDIGDSYYQRFGTSILMNFRPGGF